MLQADEQGFGRLDAIVVPVSGGGMISGVAVAAKGLDPNIRIIAAEPTGDNHSQVMMRAEVSVCAHSYVRVTRVFDSLTSF